jgi:exosortase D (VPLPA-CTERM-specific)
MTALCSTTSEEGLRSGGKQPALIMTWLLAVALAFICLASLCFTTRDGLSNLYGRWMYEDEYGYGLAIAAIVPLLLWRRWRTLLSGSAGTRWPGVAIVLLAQLCIILAVLGESYYFEQIALIVSLVGLGLIVFSTGAIRILFPIALLLLLAIPLPYTLQAVLTIKLQLLSTNLGVSIIQLLGIPVYVEGNIIDLGSYKLQVAEACSGLRYLLPLTCISVLVAYLYRAPFWKKAVLVISAAPLTIFINSFRIAVTAVLVDDFGLKMAEGFFHQFEGWIIFLMGIVLLGIEILVLEGFRWSNVEIESIFDHPSTVNRTVSPAKLVLPLILAVIVCSGTLAISISISSAFASMPPPVREGFASFPQRIGDWTGKPAGLDPEILDALKDTDNYLGDFVEKPGGVPVNLFVAYYDSLSKGAAIHSPRVCLPGSGWEFASFQEGNFSELNPGASGTYNHVLIQKGEQKILMYYWYQQRQRRTAGEFSMKYYLLVDSFFKDRKDGALVRIFTPIDPGAGDNGVPQAEARLRAFTRVLLPTLPRYLPE